MFKFSCHSIVCSAAEAGRSPRVLLDEPGEFRVLVLQ
uniref:Uncharacterized protein n=1 Tax=Arundo donax TaxID=35708 RepID=A0A0A9CNF3_ARUDO